jgi:excinuclease UvrABC ATPase subunit
LIEPTVGLHPRDIHKLVTILRTLRDKGNSVLVVEHEPSVILEADYLVDIGPRAGSHGGEVLFQGTVNELLSTGVETPTSVHLAPRPRIALPKRRKPQDFISIRDANLHNLKNVSVNIPTGVFICVTGVAGSGKSSLICGTFARQCPKAVVIDQSPVGRSSRSNPVTYSGAFDYIRKEFAAQTGQNASLFSFNSSGACQNCKGLGMTSVDMHFLESVRVKCGVCHGKRFQKEVLEFKMRDKNIAEVLDLTVDDAMEFFTGSKQIAKRLEVLQEVGLGYLTLGQSVSTLSGGEAQRLKLASELHKTGFIYIMDGKLWFCECD